MGAMSLERIKNWFKQRLHLSASTPTPQNPPPVPRPTSRKKPKGFKIPEWAKIDWFAKKDWGTMTPPQDLEDSSPRASDRLWGKNGGKNRKKFENIPGNSQKNFPRVGMSDTELSHFLGDVMNKAPDPSSDKSKKPL